MVKAWGEIEMGGSGAMMVLLVEGRDEKVQELQDDELWVVDTLHRKIHRHL
ncbi:hypothetical protein AGABI1DRAFT_113063 [Agaricus bisporus var. burnettii JB137-S8]|uniref:Uncharacterized protein n=1 Tax=Agaricus bisporus var. burnettii (strain JB137-S8 / ATCC MYA-4627 / FGSC 10392) TaxID=597362 RepID=K5XWX0_AGABU|nr:uncharacterized protein AGABI1DRAFT_113063 [Agaricus bisporus var. burnettii JB137-S8]EKM79760.1 hypothetical protein AGABI1DRAFT_113063 [Agaricus bisporus var. burnettii JB137-S8]